MSLPYVLASHTVLGTEVPVVDTHLQVRDRLGAMMVRWSINRNNYRVSPGLYAVGKPNAESDVFVSANYKLSFDALRKNLAGLNAWILVLDTKGVNVWCAAGKGTFGTAELVRQIKICELHKVVNHRKVIVPQLGAVGISAHKLKQQTKEENKPLAGNQKPMVGGISFAGLGVNVSSPKGFTVVYGPVRAEDIKAFIANGYKSTPEMREVKFGLAERAKLIPVDVLMGKYYALVAFLILLGVSGITQGGYNFELLKSNGIIYLFNFLMGYLAGIVLGPLLLPIVPFRSFALKGALLGAAVTTGLYFLGTIGDSIFEVSAWYLINTAISSFMCMNFTGSSTYTSLSGVKKEMKVAVPLQAGFSLVGLGLLVVGLLK